MGGRARGAVPREGRRLRLGLLPVSIGVLAVLVSTAASAQVIEIGDDGSSTTYDRPTRFVAEGEEPRVAHRVAAPAPFRTVGHDEAFANASTRHNVDVGLLRAVAWTESRGRADAVSHKGARGVMQLMPGTAAELGVDPRDPAANISGGAAYLARQIRTFGSVPLALAAYNAGPGAVLRWGGIPPYAETRGYVAQVLARWHKTVTSPVKGEAVQTVQAGENMFVIEVAPL